jgi:hypothetical protein
LERRKINVWCSPPGPYFLIGFALSNQFDYKFIVMRNVVGNPARGENFFERGKEVKKILNGLQKVFYPILFSVFQPMSFSVIINICPVDLKE